MDILPRLVSVSINMVNISSVFYLTELSKKKKKNHFWKYQKLLLRKYSRFFATVKANSKTNVL